VAGQYRFNRAELLEWASVQGIKVSLELFNRLEEDTDLIPTLAEALEAGGIYYNLPDTTKERALRSLVQVLPLPEDVDRDLLLALYLAREASASTGIGGGIALPHVRNPIVLHVGRPLITLAFLEKPVDFGALDGKPVQVLFSLISPTTRSHLQLLSRLSFALHDDTFKQVVIAQSPRQVILEELRRVEARVGCQVSTDAKASS
jgi:PTS system nitrogen regulatory IIA component